jgi:hypothetical protein
MVDDLYHRNDPDERDPSYDGGEDYEVLGALALVYI